MSGLGPEARSIIEAARGGDEPSSQDRKRIRTSLIARLGTGVAVASAATSAGSAAAGATKTAGLLVGLVPKGIFVLSAVGAIGLGAYFVDDAPPKEAATIVPIASASMAAEAIPVPALALSVPKEQEAPKADDAPATVAPAHAAPTGEVRRDEGPGLAAEVESLREAHTALREGRADEAMEVLDRDAALADASGLEQERAAMRVFALCRLGKTEEARSQAAAFLAMWPRSPHAARVGAACTH